MYVQMILFHIEICVGTAVPKFEKEYLFAVPHRNHFQKRMRPLEDCSRMLTSDRIVKARRL